MSSFNTFDKLKKHYYNDVANTFRKQFCDMLFIFPRKQRINLKNKRQVFIWRINFQKGNYDKQRVYAAK